MVLDGPSLMLLVNKTRLVCANFFVCSYADAPIQLDLVKDGVIYLLFFSVAEPYTTRQRRLITALQGTNADFQDTYSLQFLVGSILQVNIYFLSVVNSA